MQKTVFNLDYLNNFKSQLLFGILFLCIVFQLKAQPSTSPCLVSTYNLSTGNAKTWPTNPLVYGQQDPFWQVSDRSPVFGGTTGLPMQAILAYLPGYWGTSAGMWLSDSTNHAAPGIVAASGSYITFRRSFKICGSGEVSFNLQILNDNYIQSIAVDGVVLSGAAYNQIATATASNYTSKWTVPTFVKTLSTGTHSLEITVAETSSPDPNPIGLSLIGTISSSNNIIVNDYSSACSEYDCTTSIVATATTGNVQNELYQNSPNPFSNETNISYNVTSLQQSAFIVVCDINGKEIFRQAIAEKGKGSVTVSGDKLVPGMYLYSLIVDGKETATKRMVVTK